jgi:hypothetical protein
MPTIHGPRSIAGGVLRRRSEGLRSASSDPSSCKRERKSGSAGFAGQTTGLPLGRLSRSREGVSSFWSKAATDLARQLLQLAGDDELAARSLLAATEIADAIIGFHAQQAVEKAIKAVLSQRDVLFPYTHQHHRALLRPPRAPRARRRRPRNRRRDHASGGPATLEQRPLACNADDGAGRPPSAADLRRDR